MAGVLSARSDVILLTGANGQVGYEVARSAHHRGRRLHALDHRALDITDPGAVSERIRKIRPGVVINAAAYTAVDRAETERDQAFAVNRDGPANLARACEAAGIPLLHLSTDFVFDGGKTEPYVEADHASPLGVYGQSKWEGEEAIRLQGVPHIILRVSWVFGAHGHNFVKTMLRLAGERDEISVVADQRGCPTPAADIAAIMTTFVERILAGEGLRWGTYHYAGAPATTWHAFACAIFEEAQAVGLLERAPAVHPIRTEQYPLPAERPLNSVLDTRKWVQTFGREPRPWRAGLISVLQALRDRQD